MSAHTFASILLLRRAADQDRILSVLPQERRDAVQAELKTLGNLAPAQIQERLSKDREEQLTAQRQSAAERLGRSLEHALPRLVAWLGRPF